MEALEGGHVVGADEAKRNIDAAREAKRTVFVGAHYPVQYPGPPSSIHPPSEKSSLLGNSAHEKSRGCYAPAHNRCLDHKPFLRRSVYPAVDLLKEAISVLVLLLIGANPLQLLGREVAELLDDRTGVQIIVVLDRHSGGGHALRRWCSTFPSDLLSALRTLLLSRPVGALRALLGRFADGLRLLLPGLRTTSARHLAWPVGRTG